MGMASKLIIDAHIHLDLYEEQERRAILARSFSDESDIAAVIAVSKHMESCAANRSFAMQYLNQVHPAYGFHPEQPLPEEAAIDQLFQWIRERHQNLEEFAIGEVGLPYYSRQEAEQAGREFNEAPYIALLDEFAALASELDRPLVLHAVYEDAAKACDLLEKHNVRAAHFHWFKGDEATVERMIAGGYYISITPDVAYEEEIQSLVKCYPLELMMAETDGPWPFEGPYAGRITEPAMAADVIKHIAALKQLPEARVRNAVYRNTVQFYKLKQ